MRAALKLNRCFHLPSFIHGYFNQLLIVGYRKLNDRAICWVEKSSYFTVQCVYVMKSCWNERKYLCWLNFKIVSTQLWTARRIRMWEDDPVVMHCWKTETEFRRDLGTWRTTRFKGIRCPRTTDRLHATGNCFVWRVHHERDVDLFWMDLRNADRRCWGKSRFFFEIASASKRFTVMMKN